MAKKKSDQSPLPWETSATGEVKQTEPMMETATFSGAPTEGNGNVSQIPELVSQTVTEVPEISPDLTHTEEQYTAPANPIVDNIGSAAAFGGFTFDNESSMKLLRNDVITVPVYFTPSGIEEIAKRVARRMKEIDQLKIEAKNVANEFKSRIEATMNTVNQDLRKIGEGCEYVDRKVMIMLDYRIRKRLYFDQITMTILKEEDFRPEDYQTKLDVEPIDPDMPQACPPDVNFGQELADEIFNYSSAGNVSEQQHKAQENLKEEKEISKPEN